MNNETTDMGDPKHELYTKSNASIANYVKGDIYKIIRWLESDERKEMNDALILAGRFVKDRIKDVDDKG